MAGFDHRAIEKKAQEKWASLKLFETDLTDTTKEPYYLLCEFPYPSGDLHIGHWYAFAVTDIYARIQRMRGKNVLFPIGFDAFGLPAENAAIKNGADPAAWTLANIERMKGQLASMGPSFDWSKEIVACDPSYYHWTQWLFNKLFEHKLAYRAEASVKWCPKDQTVLANEQVHDGHCERCGTAVEEKRLTQWFLKITDYADRLIKDLDPLPWREEIKDAQRAWIGKSEGGKINFLLNFKKNPADNDNRGPDGERAQLPVFTTRPDTIYGATYLVLAPEHPWITLAIDDAHDVLENKDEIRAYVAATKQKTERERSENKDKTGVRVEGVVAINPATQEEIPIYTADYVIGSYGTGAVMAVPAHDERDFAFAQKHGLPVWRVVEPKFISDGEGTPKAGEPFVYRNAVCAVVRNPKDDTYLCSSWKEMLMHGLITGGIEEGEDPVEAARREVLEETGYKNIRHIERPEVTLNTFFYHRQKKTNRHSHFTYVFFELENEERLPIAAEEDALHEALWVKKNELKNFFTVAEGSYIVSLLDTPAYVYTGDGLLVNSGDFTGKDNREVMEEIIAAVGGEKTTSYRLRDWLVSRQRYWGCPIPIVYSPEGVATAIPSEHLPWLLPTDVDFKPTGKSSPLATSKELKERVERIFGEGWTPEYDTLDTFVDSSWYFNRYLDPKDSHDFSDQALMKKWLPVNRYSGGSEHTTMHLLYSRFFTKALYDLALVPVNEPFLERYNRGIILGTDGAKMSKSKGNVLNPDEFVERYGADAVRIYLAFIGPYNEPGNYPWNLDGVASMRKFLDRVVRLKEKSVDNEPSEAIARALARAGKKVAEDSDKFKFNTAIAALMTLLNELEVLPQVPKTALREFVLMLAPFAPHISEELYEQLGGEASAAATAWPAADESLLTSAEVEVIVQVGGKKRGSITLASEASEEDALAAALAIEAVKAALPNGHSRVIYVPGRILNLVA